MKCLAVPLDKNRSNGQPFFMVSGLGGHVITFQIIAKALTEKWLPYGLIYPGFNEDEPSYRTIDAIARRMLVDIRSIQPNGPYYLVGYSMGGFVCLEMAKQLREHGETASVTMIDVKIFKHAPYKPLPKRLPTQLYWKIKDWVQLSLGKNKQHAQKIRERLLSTGGEIPGDLNVSLQRVIRDGKQALDQYQLEKSDVPAVLIRCRDLIWYDAIREWLDDYGWSRYTDLKAVFISPGDHMNIIKYPNISSFGQNLEAALDLLMVIEN